MGTLISSLTGLAVAVSIFLMLGVKRQISDLRTRHENAWENLRNAIGQRRLVTENLIDVLSDRFYSEQQLVRIEQAEMCVKKAIISDSNLHDLVGRQVELNDSVDAILPSLRGPTYENDRMVVACLNGWDDTKELLAQATIAYNDAAMTWNEFLKSWKVRWVYLFRPPLPLSYVDWDTDSSDPGESPAADAAGK